MAATFTGQSGQSSLANTNMARPPRVRACTNCVRAKARCSPGADGEGRCERCHRMSKTCQPSPPVRKRCKSEKALRPETSRLEEKLDGLGTLSKSTKRGATGSFNPVVPGSLPLEFGLGRGASLSSTAATSIGHGQCEYNRVPRVRHETNCTSATPCASARPALSVDSEPDLEDAETYLDRFRNHFVEYLPFIIIPASVTARELRQERPILWISIMAVASSNSTQQRALSNEARAVLAREAFVEGTRNMDLFLAVLVYTTWDRHYHFGRPFLISLVHLAIAMLYDLGLDKPPSEDPVLLLAHRLKGSELPLRSSRTPSNEERRALLGCFLISSVSCFTLRKGSTLRWTVYADECLERLETEKEFESDALLVQLVKLRLISERVKDLPWSSPITKIESATTIPASFYVQSLEAQLKDFKAKIPPSQANNKTLLLELHITEVSIYEIGLSQAPGLFSGQSNRRVEYLVACVHAVKTWMGVFLGIKPAQYVGFSALEYSNMTHCFLSVYRLSTFEHVDWDRALCVDDLDVLSFLEAGEENFGQVKAAAGLYVDPDDVDTFTIMASRIHLIKLSWNAATTSLASSIVGSTYHENFELLDPFVEFSDGDWLKHLLGTDQLFF
ncbi:hypothetical protein BKA67DRAFT_214989 [Truncatella angustata]|uniref:Zn(2)-C6 fungal-type domain-containing protein n=1 Tax=Truncatella angustata TaxID=152316 RepID=A0A9P8UU14_9PEZI|nr:uncharacterized protein BKA67DRAFT_214989 [Truncatella angustata]KAH6658497.1 hypothetical protein BKA67DRAFT_214989 [Truncatella angustata]